MSPIYLAVVLSLAVLPAVAQQQPDPAQAFAKEWGVLAAADHVTAASHEHVAELAQKLIGDWQRQRAELAAVNKRAGDLGAYLKACQDKPGCTVPAE